MKRLVTIMFALMIFAFSCTSETKKQAPKKLINFKTLVTDIPFAGFWVSEVYFKNIQRTKSARESAIFDESCIEIPKKTLQVTNMVWGFHDGGEELMIVKNGDSYQFWNSTLTKKARAILVINDNRIKIDDKYFVKLQSTDHEITLSNPTILEEILFKGEYKTKDGNSVELKSDGRIVGLKDFSFYTGVLTYNEPGSEVDQIVMGKSQDQNDAYGYKFNGDTLSIYKLKCIKYNKADDYCEEVDFGELICKLAKIN